MKKDRRFVDKDEFNQEVAMSLNRGRMTERMAKMVLDMTFNIATSKAVTERVKCATEREEMMLRVIEKTYRNLKKKIETGTIYADKNAFAYVSLIILGKFRDEVKRMKYCDWLGVKSRIDEYNDEGKLILGKAAIFYFEDYELDDDE